MTGSGLEYHEAVLEFYRNAIRQNSNDEAFVMRIARKGPVQGCPKDEATFGLSTAC